MKVYLALPVLDESKNIPLLLGYLSKQSFRNFELVVCVNQPDHWWPDTNKKRICEDNQRSIEILQEWNDFPVHILDRSSKGRGWKGKHYGVGWARKTAMDAINETAVGEDIIVSIDADTFYPDNYLKSVVQLFGDDPAFMGLANPYYHQLTGDPSVDKALLRYEIYMRNYKINMILISNPYAFTALGSAMAFPVWAYRKVNGITPHKSGEDFYFLQKLKKTGKLLIHNPVMVFPSARKSDRVFFGTGPAIIKGIDNDWESYPIYHYKLFGEVRNTFSSFEAMYSQAVSTPMMNYLQQLFKEDDFTRALRKNAGSAAAFASACMRKVDALRILQYLKASEKTGNYEDGISLAENLRHFGLPSILPLQKLMNDAHLNELTVDELQEIRQLMFNHEVSLQQRTHYLV